jgi:hypothetical protein
VIDPGLQRFDPGPKLGLALVGFRERPAEIGRFPLELFEGRAILPLGFLETRFEPGGTVVQTVAIEAKCGHLFDRLITLLLQPVEILLEPCQLMTEQGCILRGRRGIRRELIRFGLLEVQSKLFSLSTDALQHGLDKLELFREPLVALESQGSSLPRNSELGFQRLELVAAIRPLIERVVACCADDIELAFEGIDPGAEDLGLLREALLCSSELGVQMLLTIECGGVQLGALLRGFLLREPQLLPPARDELLALDLPEAKALLVFPGMFDAGRLVTDLEPFVQPPLVFQPGLELLYFRSGSSEVSLGLVAFGTDGDQMLEPLDLGSRIPGFGLDTLGA